MDPHNIPDLSHFRHITPLQLRFNDVDVLGHVNNMFYFGFYDTGKARYLEAVQGAPVDWQHVETVVANVNCAFISPIYFQEEVEVLTMCVEIGVKSFRLLQVIRERNTGEIKSMCETVMVCFDPQTRKACQVSREWRQRLNAFEGRPLDSSPLTLHP